MGLHRGMPFADARAFCPDLLSAPAHPARDARFVNAAPLGHALLSLGGPGGGRRAGSGHHRIGPSFRRRSGDAGRHAGAAGPRGAGGTAGACPDARRRLGPCPSRRGKGAGGDGENPDTLGRLPVAALRLEPDTVTALERLGLRTIADLAATPRAPLTRRFGPGVLLRLDQALGTRPEQIAPETEPPHYGVRLTLPEPIGLVDDVMAGTARLVERLCARLKENAAGARALCLTLRRVDQACQQVELRLASAMRDPARILPLFERGVGTVDAGFGIDQLRLQATVVEPLADAQLGAIPAGAAGTGLKI